MIYLIPFLAYYFVSYTGIPDKLKIWWLQLKMFLDWTYKNSLPKRMRPIDCEHCLSFWLTLIYGYIFTQYQIQDLILIAGMNAVIACFIYCLFKLLR